MASHPRGSEEDSGPIRGTILKSLVDNDLDNANILKDNAEKEVSEKKKLCMAC